MNKFKTKKYNYLELIYIFLLLLLVILLVLLPRNSISSFYEGVSIWATKILPTLLPFFIITKILSNTKLIPYIEKKVSPLTNKLYGVSGVAGYIYIMSIISGYPVGAKITRDFYQNGKLTKGQAETITAFTSTSGPLFILGTVAISLFSNSKMGIIILLSHYIGAIINGLLYRQKHKDLTPPPHTITTSKESINSIITSSISSILSIGGFVALFYMLINLIITLNIFSPITTILSFIGIDRSISTALLSGIIEVTTGEIMLNQIGLSTDLAIIFSTAIISFGGLSIHAQAYTYLQDFNMPYKKFLLQKLTHSILSTLTCLLLLCIV